MSFHAEHAAAVTIALHHVEDARAFGLVATEPDGRVLAFREKPEDLIPGDINAGTYLLDPKVLRDRTPGEASSIERDIFPAVIEAGHPVFGFLAEAYWLDLGTPEKYLQAHFDMLEGKVHDVSYPAPWIADGAAVDLRAHLGRWVAVGERASIGPEAQVDDSVLHADVAIAAGARIAGSIIAKAATVGEGATVIDSVIGEGASVPAGPHAGGGPHRGRGDRLGPPRRLNRWPNGADASVDVLRRCAKVGTCRT